MYGIFPYIYHTNQPNVGKYTSHMDPMGKDRWIRMDDLGGLMVFVEVKRCVRNTQQQKKYFNNMAYYGLNE